MRYREGLAGGRLWRVAIGDVIVFIATGADGAPVATVFNFAASGKVDKACREWEW